MQGENEMRAIFVVLFLAAIASTASAQTQSGQSLAATLEVYVFPTSGQEASQQSKDEAKCFSWAETNTGVDPFHVDKDTEQQQQRAAEQAQAVQESTRGAGARGAIRGAAAGALIGEIADDDASKGAAWGAALGAARSRRHARHNQAQAQQQAEQSVDEQKAYAEDKVENFKKAFSVCLEAKDYMVRY
jgi:hypothetical protein